MRGKNISGPFVDTNINFKTLDSSNELNDTEKEQLTNLITRYQELFSQKGGRIGCTNLTALVIENGDAKSVHCSPYRTLLKEQELIQREVEKCKAGIIEPSDSCWSGPLVLISKDPVAGAW